jgi:hypothetical protein
MNALFGSRHQFSEGPSRLFNNPPTSFWYLKGFAIWIHFLVQEHQPCDGPSKLLDIPSTSFWHFHTFAKWLHYLIQEHHGCKGLAKILNSHLTPFGHFMTSQSDCIEFKNTSIVNVLQNSLIVIQYAFEQNSWLFIIAKLFGIVGLNFLI